MRERVCEREREREKGKERESCPLSRRGLEYVDVTALEVTAALCVCACMRERESELFN